MIDCVNVAMAVAARAVAWRVKGIYLHLQRTFPIDVKILLHNRELTYGLFVCEFSEHEVDPGWLLHDLESARWWVSAWSGLDNAAADM